MLAPSLSRWLASPSCRIILPQYQKQASRFSRRGRRERERKKKSRKGRKKITFFSEGNERALSAAAEERGKPISLFAAAALPVYHQVSLELEKNLSNGESSLPPFERDGRSSVRPSFTPIIARAGTRENNVKRRKKGQKK